MLQQTQVSAVQESFQKWIRDFPTVEILAKASDQEVLEHWRGLGYYSRARNIHKTAQEIVRRGRFPGSRKELEALPGIGAYTAGAILSFAFHFPEPILDGNLIRVFSRLYLWKSLPTDGKSEHDRYWNEASAWAKSDKAFLTNEALMELGRSICKRSNPSCSLCPISKFCEAFRKNLQSEYPRKKSVAYTSWLGFALVILDAEGKFFLPENCPRPFLKNQPGFPMVESADAFRDVFPAAAESLIPFEFAQKFRFVGTVEHSITHYRIRCRVLCVLANSDLKIPGEWLSKEQISRKMVSSLSRKILGLVHEF